MYAPVERIVAWSRDGRGPRRPLILCEYNHAMGQAGGLADYWAVFGVERGLQGGFVWEWCDHALRRREPDGSTWLAYGGDFGEVEHDGHFVCDGLVSRRPCAASAARRAGRADAAGRCRAEPATAACSCPTAAGSPPSTTSRRRGRVEVDGRRHRRPGGCDLADVATAAAPVVDLPDGATAATVA